MYRLYSIIIAFTLENRNAAVIHLNHLKFNVNGAPSVNQKHNATTAPETFKVYIGEDKGDKETATNRKDEETKSNNNVTAATNSPIIVNIQKTDPISKKPQHKDVLAEKVKTQNKEVQQNGITKTTPLFKITVLKPTQEITTNYIEVRKMSEFNEYVPISEDIMHKYSEVPFGRGVGRRELSLVDLDGNMLLFPFVTSDNLFR